ncbi:MAG: hypothetical protein P1V19_22455 [Gimesia sp.]|nr:hypothetical protein [Gimesia sp.]
MLMNATSKLTSILSGEQGQLSCFDIEVFHLNQRRSRNPKYSEILESARNKGIQDSLHVVYHPVQKKWVLSQGGQTRLLICRELYEETGQENFLYPPTVKQKYTSDLDLCISHLVDNHLRGDNTFLETANAVVNIRKLIAESNGTEPTQEELTEEMSRRGMPIRRQSVTAMLYLSEDIAPKITNSAFLDSVSRKVVDSIRALRNDLGKEFSGDEFDARLVDFINSKPENVSLKLLREHFLPGVPAKGNPPRSNKAIASSISNTFGLGDVVLGTDDLQSGFLVNLSEAVQDGIQAEVCFFLTSLSGVFDGPVSDDVVEGMGLGVAGGDPATLADAVRARLNLCDWDLLGLTSRIFCQANDEGFELLVRLIAGLRTSFHSNNNPLEKR